MQKYGKIRKLPRLPTKKSQKNFIRCYFAIQTTQDHTIKPIFRPNLPERYLGLFGPFCRVLLHLIVKTGFMSLKYFLNLHHFSSISRRLSVNARHFLKKRWTFLKKSRTFLQKRGSFFSVPSERRFLTANRNTKKSRKWKSSKHRSSTFNC